MLTLWLCLLWLPLSMFLPCRDLVHIFYLRRNTFTWEFVFTLPNFLAFKMFFQWDSVCYKLLALALASPRPSWYPSFRMSPVSIWTAPMTVNSKASSLNVTFSVVFKMQAWGSSYKRFVHCCWRHGNRRFPIFSCGWFYKPLLTLAIAIQNVWGRLPHNTLISTSCWKVSSMSKLSSNSTKCGSQKVPWFDLELYQQRTALKDSTSSR